VPFDEYQHYSIITVKTRWLGGVTDNGFGIIFGYIDNKNFYDFQICQDGYFRLSKQTKGEWNNLIEWKKSGAIQTGSNFLKVAYQGKSLTCSINNTIVAAVQDEMSGSDYVLAGVGANGDIKCSFDDFSIQEQITDSTL
jgi:hypothetical protein